MERRVVRVDDATYAELKRRAAESGRSIGEEVARAVNRPEEPVPRPVAAPAPGRSASTVSGFVPVSAVVPRTVEELVERIGARPDGEAGREAYEQRNARRGEPGAPGAPIDVDEAVVRLKAANEKPAPHQTDHDRAVIAQTTRRRENH